MCGAVGGKARIETQISSRYTPMDADRPETGLFDRDQFHGSEVYSGVAAARTVHLRPSACICC
jgi:hypothetical protein